MLVVIGHPCSGTFTMRSFPGRRGGKNARRWVKRLLALHGESKSRDAFIARMLTDTEARREKYPDGPHVFYSGKELREEPLGRCQAVSEGKRCVFSEIHEQRGRAGHKDREGRTWTLTP